MQYSKKQNPYASSRGAEGRCILMEDPRAIPATSRTEIIEMMETSISVVIGFSLFFFEIHDGGTWMDLNGIFE
jgi:hypothetical protein